MPKTVKGGPLGFFNIRSVAKYQKIEGRTFGDMKKKLKKSLTKPKGGVS